MWVSCSRARHSSSSVRQHRSSRLSLRPGLHTMKSATSTAPFSVTPKDVRAGDCVIIYSGNTAVFEACHDVLRALGSKPQLVGDRPGVATAFDKAFFAFYYAHALGLLHGAAICRAAGVPLDAYLDLMVDNWDWKLPDSVTAEALKSGDYAVREGTLENARPRLQSGCAILQEDRRRRRLGRRHRGHPQSRHQPWSRAPRTWFVDRSPGLEERINTAPPPVPTGLGRHCLP